MRKLWMTAALVCSMMIGTKEAKAQDFNALVGIAAEVLADQYGLRSNNIYDDSRNYGVPVYDLAPAYAIRSRARGTSLQRIYELRRQGLTWSQIARQVGIPAYQVEDMAKRNLLDMDGYWANIVYRRYGVPQRQWHAVRRSGANWNQAFLASQIGRQVRTEPIYVFQSYRKNGNWNKLVLPNRKVVNFVPTRTSPLYRVWHPTKAKSSTSTRALGISKPSSAKSGVRTSVKSKGTTRTSVKSNGKVTQKRSIKTNGDRTVRRQIIRNPAQTIRKTQIKTDGKVTTKVTHNRTKATGKTTVKKDVRGSGKSDKGNGKGKR